MIWSITVMSGCPVTTWVSAPARSGTILARMSSSQG